MTSISGLLLHNARWRAAQPAVVYGDSCFTYAALAKRTFRCAHALRALGVRRGDRVAVLSTNHSSYVEVVFALGFLGATLVPLNFRLAPAELAYIAGDAKAAALIYSPDLEESAARIRDDLPEVQTWIAFGERCTLGRAYEALLDESSDAPLEPAAGGADLFTIMYTSGTTGKPKGVMLTHAAFLRGTERLALAARAVPGERHLQVIPQFHAGGQIYQLAHLMVGATVVIAPRFDPGLIVRLIESEGITSAGFVPTMLVALLEEPRLRTANLGRLARVMYGGSPIPQDRLALAMEIIPAGFQQTYGQTETGVIVTVLDSDDHAQGLRERPALLQSCGRPIPGYAVRLVDDDGADAAPGAIGELAVAGDSMMSGYLNRPDATAKALKDGWVYTGDMGWADDEGYLYVVDRRSDLIISGGENIYPLQIEQVLSAHPDVLDVAVIGIPDERWGEAVKAVIVPRPGASVDIEAIREFCRANLAGFKVPRSVDLVAAIPRNASGKILKRELREPYWAGRSKRV